MTATFREVRGYYNDSQIIELTETVGFFNYFTRLAEALNLPLRHGYLILRHARMFRHFILCRSHTVPHG